MKHLTLDRRFLLVAAFLLGGVWGGPARSQSFVVQSGAPVTIECACGDIVYDSSLVIRNTTGATLTVNTWFREPYGFGYRSDVSINPIPPNGTGRVQVYYNAAHADSSVDRTEIVLAAGQDTLRVPIVAIRKPYAVCASGWQDVYATNIHVGDTNVVTYWGRNRSQKPISFYGVNNEYGSDSTQLRIHPRIPLPYVILPGEDLPLFDLLYSPTRPNQSVSTRLGASFGSHECDSPAPLDFHGSSQLDSNLLRPCLEIVGHKDLYGPALIGGDEIDTIYVRNNRYSSLSLDGLSFQSGDNGFFSAAGSFPISIPSLSTIPVLMQFSPRAGAGFVKYRYAVAASLDYDGTPAGLHCSSTPVDLAALAMLPTADSVASPLYPQITYYLGMSGTSPSFSQDFHFVNNGSTNVKIVSVGLARPSSEFAITNILPGSTLPLTLTPGQTLTVTVSFTAGALNKLFYNALMIVTDKGVQAVTYPLQGLRQSTSGVTEGEASDGMQIQLRPNPASRAVRVLTRAGNRIIRCQLVDVLGSTLAEVAGVGASECEFDLSILHIPSGSYFVRTEGVTETQRPFVRTCRVEIER